MSSNSDKIVKVVRCNNIKNQKGIKIEKIKKDARDNDNNKKISKSIKVKKDTCDGDNNDYNQKRGRSRKIKKDAYDSDNDECDKNKQKRCFRNYNELKEKLTDEQRELINELVENTPEDISGKLTERKWSNFIDYYNIGSKQDLLNFDINKATKIYDTFACKRADFVKVLSSPPYSMKVNKLENKKNFKDEKTLASILTDEQKELIEELIENTPDSSKKELTERKWKIFIDYYGIKTKQELLEFDFNKATNISGLFKCKRYHFANVLSSPPYSLNIKHNNYDKTKDNSKLESVLTNEQEKILKELVKNTPKEIKKDLTKLKWSNFLKYYDISNKQALLNLEFNKVMNTEATLSCKREHFATVLCAPPYSLAKIIRYDNLLSDNQKEIVSELKEYLTAQKTKKTKMMHLITAFSSFLYKFNDIDKEKIKDTENIQKIINDNEFTVERNMVKNAINEYYAIINHTKKLITREMYMVKNKKNERYEIKPRMVKYTENFVENKELIKNFIDKLKIHCKVKDFKQRTFEDYFDTIIDIFDCLKKDNLINNRETAGNMTIEQFFDSLKKNYDPKKINPRTLSRLNGLMTMNIFPAIDCKTVIKLENIIDGEKVIEFNDVEVNDKEKLVIILQTNNWKE